MRTLPHLWQRVLAYAVFLVLVSNVVGYLVFKLSTEQDMEMRFLADNCLDIANFLEGRDTQSVEVFLEFFSRPHRTLWLETPGGAALLGNPPTGLEMERRKDFPILHMPQYGVDLLLTDLPRRPHMAVVETTLREGPALVCMLENERPPPPPFTRLPQWLIAVFIIGGALSVWITWRIARPLRRLRSEVLVLAEGDLDTRVSVQGSDEIAEVALAVNKLADNLARNIKSMQKLVANISHEMRSPLTRMSISAAIIEEGLLALVGQFQSTPRSNTGIPLDGLGRPLAVKHVYNLLREIEHMEKLIGSSLLNSRLDLQQETPRLEPLDLSALCEEMVRRHETQIQGQGLVFARSIETGVWIKGDEALFALVLSNLLDNAAKYTSPGGEIRLRLTVEEHEAVLRLENSHPGIDPDLLPHLFEPFFRAGLGTANSDGVGLGLALVEKIVASHGGGIHVENGGMGILFRLGLPVDEPPT